MSIKGRKVKCNKSSKFGIRNMKKSIYMLCRAAPALLKS